MKRRVKGRERQRGSCRERWGRERQKERKRAPEGKSERQRRNCRERWGEKETEKVREGP